MSTRYAPRRESVSEATTAIPRNGRIYYARRLTYALLKELKTTVIEIPDCATPIFVKRPPKKHADVPLDFVNGYHGKQFSWETHKQLYVLPEHRVLGAEAAWPMPDVRQWMAYEAGHISKRTTMKNFFGQEYAQTPADRTATLPEDLRRGLLPGAIVLMEDRSGCGRCPFALMCLRNRQLSPGPNQRFYFALCPRCNCLAITDTETCTRYICGVMRADKTAPIIERDVANDHGGRGLLAPSQCCIEHWMSVKEWASVDRNDCPKHYAQVTCRDGMQWITAYDCLEHYRMLAAKHNITIEDQDGIRERTTLP